MKRLIAHSVAETEQIAGNWLKEAAQKYPRMGEASDKALIIGLSGHLGAGKTAFVKAVAKALGIKEILTSPTFVIMKLYEIPEGHSHSQWPWKRLVHIDAYRLEQPEELEALDFEALTADPHDLIMVEWPANVKLSAAETLGFELKKEGIVEVSF